MTEDRDDQPDPNRGGWLIALGAGCGVALGAGVGVAFDQIALGAGIGTALGAAAGTLAMVIRGGRGSR